MSSHDHARPDVAVITLARDEGAMLPRWIDYYSKEVGVENLIVFDDNSEDGSTDELPCSVHRLPTMPGRAEWEWARVELMSGIAKGLLACYDAVVFCDVDEFIIADPARYSDIVDYIARHSDQPVIAPIGLNVIHHVDVEDPIDPLRPVLGQRRYAKFVSVMCKPSVKRIDASWRNASHAILHPFEVDRDLYMIHLKFYDLDHLRATADKRRRLVDTDGRGAKSTWKLDGDEMVAELRSFVAGADPASVADFDPAGVEIQIEEVEGKFRVAGDRQLYEMGWRPLVKVPERLLGLV